MAYSLDKLTTHTRTGVICAEPKVNREACQNMTWELCDKCNTAVCGVHVVVHYRRHHPEML